MEAHTDKIQSAIHENRVSREEEHDFSDVPFCWPDQTDLYDRLLVNDVEEGE